MKPENAAAILFQSSLNDGENLLSYSSWYDTKTIIYLSQLNPNKKMPCIVPDYSTTESFFEKFRVLWIFKNQLKKPIASIFLEPGNGLNTHHFIFCLIWGNKLLIINPVGITHHSSFYEELCKVKNDCKIENVFISTSQIQNEENQYSCGPICVEILRSISALTVSEIDSFFIKNESITKNDLSYIPVDVMSLLPQLKEIEQQDWINSVKKIRASHLSILRFKFKHNMPSIDKQNEILEGCLNNPEQVLFAKLVNRDITLLQLFGENEFKALKPRDLESKISTIFEEVDMVEKNEDADRLSTRGSTTMVKSKEPINIDVVYDEIIIMKVWEAFLIKKKLKFGYITKEKNFEIAENLFSEDDSLTLPIKKQASMILDEGELYHVGFLSQVRTVSICGVIKDESENILQKKLNFHDFKLAMKQIRIWNDKQKEFATFVKKHMVVFPYHIDTYHWTLGVVCIDLQYDGMYNVNKCEFEIFIFDPLRNNIVQDIKVKPYLDDTLKQIFHVSPIMKRRGEKILKIKIQQAPNDTVSCGVIVAENGKSLLNGDVSCFSTAYPKYTQELRKKHKNEVNDPKFSDRLSRIANYSESSIRESFTVEETKNLTDAFWEVVNELKNDSRDSFVKTFLSLGELLGDDHVHNFRKLSEREEGADLEPGDKVKIASFLPTTRYIRYYSLNQLLFDPTKELHNFLKNLIVEHKSVFYKKKVEKRNNLLNVILTKEYGYQPGAHEFLENIALDSFKKNKFQRNGQNLNFDSDKSFEIETSSNIIKALKSKSAFSHIILLICKQGSVELIDKSIIFLCCNEYFLNLLHDAFLDAASTQNSDAIIESLCECSIEVDISISQLKYSQDLIWEVINCIEHTQTDQVFSREDCAENYSEKNKKGTEGNSSSPNVSRLNMVFERIEEGLNTIKRTNQLAKDKIASNVDTIIDALFQISWACQSIPTEDIFIKQKKRHPIVIGQYFSERNWYLLRQLSSFLYAAIEESKINDKILLLKHLNIILTNQGSDEIREGSWTDLFYTYLNEIKLLMVKRTINEDLLLYKNTNQGMQPIFFTDLEESLNKYLNQKLLRKCVKTLNDLKLQLTHFKKNNVYTSDEIQSFLRIIEIVGETTHLFSNDLKCILKSIHNVDYLEELYKFRTVSHHNTIAIQAYLLKKQSYLKAIATGLLSYFLPLLTKVNKYYESHGDFPIFLCTNNTEFEIPAKNNSKILEIIEPSLVKRKIDYVIGCVLTVSKLIDSNKMKFFFESLNVHDEFIIESLLNINAEGNISTSFCDSKYKNYLQNEKKFIEHLKREYATKSEFHTLILNILRKAHDLTLSYEEIEMALQKSPRLNYRPRCQARKTLSEYINNKLTGDVCKKMDDEELQLNIRSAIFPNQLDQSSIDEMFKQSGKISKLLKIVNCQTSEEEIKKTFDEITSQYNLAIVVSPDISAINMSLDDQQGVKKDQNRKESQQKIISKCEDVLNKINWYIEYFNGKETGNEAKPVVVKKDLESLIFIDVETINSVYPQGNISKVIFDKTPPNKQEKCLLKNVDKYIDNCKRILNGSDYNNKHQNGLKDFKKIKEIEKCLKNLKNDTRKAKLMESDVNHLCKLIQDFLDKLKKNFTEGNIEKFCDEFINKLDEISKSINDDPRLYFAALLDSDPSLIQQRDIDLLKKICDEMIPNQNNFEKLIESSRSEILNILTVNNEDLLSLSKGELDSFLKRAFPGWLTPIYTKIYHIFYKKKYSSEFDKFINDFDSSFLNDLSEVQYVNVNGNFQKIFHAELIHNQEIKQENIENEEILSSSLEKVFSNKKDGFQLFVNCFGYAYEPYFSKIYEKLNKEKNHRSNSKAIENLLKEYFALLESLACLFKQAQQVSEFTQQMLLLFEYRIERLGLVSQKLIEFDVLEVNYPVTISPHYLQTITICRKSLAHYPLEIDQELSEYLFSSLILDSRLSIEKFDKIDSNPRLPKLDFLHTRTVTIEDLTSNENNIYLCAVANGFEPDIKIYHSSFNSSFGIQGDINVLVQPLEIEAISFSQQVGLIYKLQVELSRMLNADVRIFSTNTLHRTRAILPVHIEKISNDALTVPELATKEEFRKIYVENRFSSVKLSTGKSVKRSDVDYYIKIRNIFELIFGKDNVSDQEILTTIVDKIKMEELLLRRINEYEENKDGNKLNKLIDLLLTFIINPNVMQYQPIILPDNIFSLKHDEQPRYLAPMILKNIKHEMFPKCYPPRILHEKSVNDGRDFYLHLTENPFLKYTPDKDVFIIKVNDEELSYEYLMKIVTNDQPHDNIPEHIGAKINPDKQFNMLCFRATQYFPHQDAKFKTISHEKSITIKQLWKINNHFYNLDWSEDTYARYIAYNAVLGTAIFIAETDDSSILIHHQGFCVKLSPHEKQIMFVYTENNNIFSYQRYDIAFSNFRKCISEKKSINNRTGLIDYISNILKVSIERIRMALQSKIDIQEFKNATLVEYAPTQEFFNKRSKETRLARQERYDNNLYIRKIISSKAEQYLAAVSSEIKRLGDLALSLLDVVKVDKEIEEIAREYFSNNQAKLLDGFLILDNEQKFNAMCYPIAIRRSLRPTNVEMFVNNAIIGMYEIELNTKELKEKKSRILKDTRDRFANQYQFRISLPPHEWTTGFDYLGDDCFYFDKVYSYLRSLLRPLKNVAAIEFLRYYITSRAKSQTGDFVNFFRDEYLNDSQIYMKANITTCDIITDFHNEVEFEYYSLMNRKQSDWESCDKISYPAKVGDLINDIFNQSVEIYSKLELRGKDNIKFKIPNIFNGILEFYSELDPRLRLIHAFMPNNKHRCKASIPTVSLESYVEFVKKYGAVTFGYETETLGKAVFTPKFKSIYDLLNYHHWSYEQIHQYRSDTEFKIDEEKIKDYYEFREKYDNLEKKISFLKEIKNEIEKLRKDIHKHLNQKRLREATYLFAKINSMVSVYKQLILAIDVSIKQIANLPFCKKRYLAVLKTPEALDQLKSYMSHDYLLDFLRNALAKIRFAAIDELEKTMGFKREIMLQFQERSSAILLEINSSLKQTNNFKNYHRRKIGYPGFLSHFGLRENKVTAPRVLRLLESLANTSNYDRRKISLAANEFIIWARKKNRHFNLSGFLKYTSNRDIEKQLRRLP